VTPDDLYLNGSRWRILQSGKKAADVIMQMYSMLPEQMQEQFIICLDEAKLTPFYEKQLKQLKQS
jgi:hypothetical protein